ncbi:CHAP domain-containing protein [Patescibacteria group bacterium]|nr:CHAP domain-containing protein [Patescibacteria group bacterium]
MPSFDDWEHNKSRLENVRSTEEEPHEEHRDEEEQEQNTTSARNRAAELRDRLKEKIKEKIKAKVKKEEKQVAEKAAKKAIWEVVGDAIGGALEGLVDILVAVIPWILLAILIIVIIAAGIYMVGQAVCSNGIIHSWVNWLLKLFELLGNIVGAVARYFGVNFPTDFVQIVYNNMGSFCSFINGGGGNGGGLSAVTPPGWREILTDAGKQLGVPPAMIGAIYLTEHHITGFASDVTPGADEPGCSVNSSGAIGPFQVLTSWLPDLNAHAYQWGFSGSFDLCNYKEAAYAAAYILQGKESANYGIDCPQLTPPQIAATFDTVFSDQQAHALGCRYCGGDQVTGCGNANFSYGQFAAQRYFALLGNFIQSTNIVQLAESQLGTRENPMGSNCNPYSQQGSVCANSEYAEAWCADFTMWVYQHAGKAIAYQSANAFQLWSHMQQLSSPVPGSVYYISEDGAANPTPTMGYDDGHVGIVISYDASSDTLLTINGNWGNMVQEQSYPHFSQNPFIAKTFGYVP